MRFTIIKDYDELKEMAENKFNKSMLSYMEFRANPFYVLEDSKENADEQDTSQKKSTDRFKYALNEYDFLSDQERKINQNLLLPFEILGLDKVLGMKEVVKLKENTGKELMDHHYSQVIFLFPGDYFHTNEIYPFIKKRHQRCRAYVNKFKILRFEITKEVYDHYIDVKNWPPHFISQFSNPENSLPVKAKL